ncbi:hypothetical protein [Streptomyces mirabilis]|uniref:hypothetical protein n=1 Tax=Streptomyces mirabilis TaxID=68239 RepID=UPI0036B1667C
MGVSAPPTPAPRRGRVSRAGRTRKSSAGQAAEAVANLLDALDRRRGRLRSGEQQRPFKPRPPGPDPPGRWPP